MAAITRRDYEAALGCIDRLYDCGSLEEFPRVALREIPKLVRADHSTFNYVALSVPKVVVLATHEPPDHGRRQKIFSKYVSDHPILRHYLVTGDGSAYKISDFQSVREYHRLPLYQHFYHEIGYEDQLSIILFPPGSEMVTISLARDRRSFTERDRQLLNLLRPHVARAYRHIEHLGVANRSLARPDASARDMQATSVVLDGRDRPVHFGPQAESWMRRFFPERPPAGGLPEEVAVWLKRLRQERWRLPAGRPAPRSLLRERQGQRLRLRVIPALTASRRILVLGLETASTTAHLAMASRLTRREVEVLLQVEQGKTNGEAAATMGISPYTIRTHLEHVFDKLRVPSRTAAVQRFRRMTRQW